MNDNISKALSKFKRKKISVFLLLITCLVGNAQNNCSLVYGDLSYLSPMITISVSIEFDTLFVVGYGTEKEFVEKMKQKFEEKKEGGGVKWENSWNEKRTAVFARRFKTLFYKYSELDSAASPQYHLIVRPTKLIPGFDDQEGTHYAFLSGEAYLVKTSEPHKRLAKIIFNNVRGEGIVADYTGSVRIGDAYAIAGRKVGRLVNQSMK